MTQTDARQAQQAFRARAGDSVFRAAYALTGTPRQARQLTQALFEDMERTHGGRPPSGAPELYMLSRINLIYARGDWRHIALPEREEGTAREEPPAQEPPPAREPPPVGRAMTGEAPCTPHPREESDPAQPPTAYSATACYDPALTQPWSPEMERQGMALPAQEPPQESPARAQGERRSVPLSVLNAALTWGAVGAAAYLALSLRP